MILVLLFILHVIILHPSKIFIRSLMIPVCGLQVGRVLQRVLLELLPVNTLYDLWLLLTIVT
jgi:hypothetical protein